jgi:hypothetical protein
VQSKLIKLQAVTALESIIAAMLAASTSSSNLSAPLQFQQMTLSQARDTISRPAKNSEPKLLCAVGRSLRVAWHAASDLHDSSVKSLTEEVIRLEKAGIYPYASENVKLLNNKVRRFDAESEHYQSRYYDAMIPILILLGESEPEVKRLRQYLLGGSNYKEAYNSASCKDYCGKEFIQFLMSREQISASALFHNKGLRAFCQAYNVELW